MQFIKIIGWFIFGIFALWASILIFLFIKYPDMDCENKNPIFQEYTYDSKEYQLELIKLLKESDLEKTKFWFGDYIDSTHITIEIQNQNICAEGLVTVPKFEKEGRFMNHLMAVKGVSYGGPLLGVKFDFEEDVLNPEIILSSVYDIVD